MSQIIQVGECEGHPVFGYAPEPQAIPWGFTVNLLQSDGLLFECERKGCTWQQFPASGIPLTELVAMAVEHAGEHRG